MVSVVERHWGLGARVLADVFLPNGTAEDREPFARFQRRSASREAASAALSAVYERDSTEQLSRVRAPTLVLHRRQDRAIPFALGREVAELVPGSTFVELTGDDHFPWLGDSRGGDRRGRSVPRGPASVLRRPTSRPQPP